VNNPNKLDNLGNDFLDKYQMLGTAIIKVKSNIYQNQNQKVKIWL
tara:strand:+ start:1948 stop:2082 length:135 start_codon:yes stop_codon:yes gene_type:complete